MTAAGAAKHSELRGRWTARAIAAIVVFIYDCALSIISGVAMKAGATQPPVFAFSRAEHGMRTTAGAETKSFP
jgi:hypothetical protein